MSMSSSSSAANVGFSLGPDVETLRIVAPENIASFTLPQEVLSFKPSEDVIYQRFKDGDKERKIHCNVKLTDTEQRQLGLLQEEARVQNIVFSPTVATMATRFLDVTRGDVKQACALMQRTDDWRADFFKEPLTDVQVSDFMRHGVIYWVGRDKCLRPTLVFRGKRVPQECYQEKNFDGIIHSCLFCIEYFLRYMVVPGIVEGMNIIIDLDGVQISQVPVSALKGIHKSLANNSPGRVNKFYLCNLSMFLKPLVSVAKAVLTNRQNMKLQFVSDIKDLRADFALHQLEVDLGGTRPLATQFWPFSLQPGPFDAGFDGGPAVDQVSGVHELLTPAGARGRLWDPQRSSSENAALEYSDKAMEIFTKCGLPVPPECAAEGRSSAYARKPFLRRSTRRFFEKLGLTRMLSRFANRSCRTSSCVTLHKSDIDSNNDPSTQRGTAKVLLGSEADSRRAKASGFAAWQKELDMLRRRRAASPFSTTV
jgi:hypothetical protein